MSSPEWKDLERLWQSPPAATVGDIIARQNRRRWLSRLNLFAEIAVVIMGFGVSVWALTLDRPAALLSGGGALALTLFAAGASLWARFPRRSAAEVSVTAAVDVAVDRARASVRYGLASFWIVVAALVFEAAMMVSWGVAADAPPDTARGLLVFIGAMTAWIAGCQAFSIVYYVRRSAELARLEEIRRSLAAEDD
jgi:hypothetical protein